MVSEQHIDDNDDIGAWFTAGESSEQATDESLAPDSRGRVIRARPLALADASERIANSTRRRRLATVVSFVLLSSVALIAIALFSHEQLSMPATPVAERGDAVRESNRSNLESPAADVSLAPVAEASSSAVVPVPSAQLPEAEQHQSSTPPQPVRISQAVTSPPEQPAATRRGLPNAIPRRSTHVEPGIPFSEIYVNGNGDLVDARGKPLDWKSSQVKAPADATHGQEVKTRDAGSE